MTSILHNLRGLYQRIRPLGRQSLAQSKEALLTVGVPSAWVFVRLQPPPARGSHTGAPGGTVHWPRGLGGLQSPCRSAILLFLPQSIFDN